MSSHQTFARTLHDLGAAAWFGGALMGAVGLHGASSAMPPGERVHVADVGWQRWKPWKAVAITLHVGGSLSLLWGNKERLTGQHGAMMIDLVKVGAFTAALAADLYASTLGRRVGEQQPAPVGSAVEPNRETPAELEATQRRLRVVQWAVPVLSGLTIALAAKMGEQQRPTSVLSGGARRLDPRR